MMRRALILALLHLQACDATDPDPQHRTREIAFEPWPEDASRLAAGWIPLLVLADSKPCPGALTVAEPIPSSTHWISSGTVARTGVRERVLEESEPGVLRADARGLAWWLPDSASGVWMLRASQGDRVGSWPITRNRLEELRVLARNGYSWRALELLPIRNWKVRVRNPHGWPLREIPMFLTSPDRRVLARLAWTSDSAITGIYIPDDRRADGNQSLRIRAGFDEEHTLLVPRNIKGSILEFDLTDTGSLQVELLGADGEPVLEPRAVFLQDVDSEEDYDWNGNVLSLANSPSAVSHDGRAILRGVPIDRRWRIASCLLPDDVWVVTEAVGPTRPGETVGVRLSSATTSTLFQGRLLDASGTPAASANCKLRAGEASFLPISTDSDGRFTARVPNRMLQDNADLVLDCREWPIRPSSSVTILAREFTMVPSEKDWTWSEIPPLVMGQVVDESGTGVPWATIMSSSLLHPETTNEEGYFLLDASEDVVDEEGLIEASSPWHLKAEVVFRPGQRNLQIRVKLGARIAGRIAGRNPEMLSVWYYLRPDDTEPRLGGSITWQSQHGEFEFGPIPEDATEVRIIPFDDGVITLKNLRLEAGKVYKLPKSVQLDK